MTAGPLQHDYAPQIPRVIIGGHETAAVSRSDLAGQMVRDCLGNREARGLPRLIFDANGQSISMIVTDQRFRYAMERADLIVADGMSLVTASRLLSRVVLPERVTITDFVHDAAAAAQEHGLSFFLLGGTADRNAAAGRELQRLYPHLRIAGGHHGYFTEKESEGVCARIRASGADVLWVGMGRPRQEEWAARHREELAGVGWVKTCGGLFGYLAGEEPRAPLWMQRHNLEWLFRMINDPRRLAWRYVVTNPHAMYRLVRETR